MTIDDWCTPTGEYEPHQAEDAASNAPGAPPNRGEAIDPVFGLTEGELCIADAFFHELALEAARDPRPPTPEEQEAIDDLRERAERLKTMTPAELATERERLRRLGW